MVLLGIQIGGWQVWGWFQNGKTETRLVGCNVFVPFWLFTWKTPFWCQSGGVTFLYGTWWAPSQRADQLEQEYCQLLQDCKYCLSCSAPVEYNLNFLMSLVRNEEWPRCWKNPNKNLSLSSGKHLWTGSLTSLHAGGWTIACTST